MEIHRTAIIDPKAYLADGVSIGPYCTIGPSVSIGRGTVLDSHVVIKCNTRIGENCRVHSFAAIGGDPQDVKFDGAPSYAEIGDRCIIGEYVTVHRGSREGWVTRVGSDCFLMSGVHIAHDCQVGNRVTMSNFAQLGGHVVIEDRTVIGGLAAFHQFCRVGRMAMVGGTAGVMKDIAPFSMAAGGPPAVLHGLNRIGLQRNGVSEESIFAIKQCYRLTFLRGMTRQNALAEIEASLPKTPEVLHFIQFMSVDSKRGYSSAVPLAAPTLSVVEERREADDEGAAPTAMPGGY